MTVVRKGVYTFATGKRTGTTEYSHFYSQYTRKIFFDSKDDLLTKLRPGVVGLILEEKDQRETFLASVWQCLSNPRDFLNHLKMKSGLPENYWSDSI